MASVATSTACASCGAMTARPLPRLTHVLHIEPPGQCAQCQGCGLLFVSPRPDQAGFYDTEDYYALSPLVGGREAVAPHLIARLALLERRLGQRGRFLDVGCAYGAFVAYAAAQGWQAEGVDLSPVATQAAREQGLQVATGTLQAQSYPDAAFAIVHSSHMLEHDPHPLATLQEMRRILAPNGLLSLEVPQETRSFNLALRRMRGARDPLPSPHLIFFTATTLSALVQRAGFQVISISTRNYDLAGRRWFTPGYPVTRALGWLDSMTKRGPYLELLARSY